MCFRDRITPEMAKKFLEETMFVEINFETPKCCGEKMLFIPTNTGNPVFFCEKCEKTIEVD